MAKKKTPKLGRTFEIEDAHKWQGQEIGAESSTTLEDDMGVGCATIVRSFQFGANPQAFKEHIPSKQDLFNHHYKQIEVSLWQDGLSVMPEVEPRVMISKDKKSYTIIVGANPSRGHLLNEEPQKLTDIANATKIRPR